MRRLSRIAATVAAGALLLTGCEFEGAYDLPLPGSPVDADEAYEVTAEFADVLNVVPRSVVMVDDVTVGEVVEVDRVGWHAKVTMRIKDGTALPDNAIAEIRQSSLLGEKYVALDAPVGVAPKGVLEDGDEIPLSATGRNPEVEEVLGALSFLLSGGGVGQLGVITQELNQVMSGRTERLRHLLGSLEDVVGTIDAQKGQVISAMESLNGLAQTLNSEKETIDGALEVMGPAVDVLRAQHDELIRMLSSLDRLGRVGTRVIGASKDDIISTLRSLRPVLQRLNEAGDSLAPGLDMLISFPFPQEAADVVKGDYANASIRAGINLEILAQGNDNPLPTPDPTEILGAVQQCLENGNPASKACQKVLDDANLYKKLKKSCKKKKYEDQPICQLVNPLPDPDEDDPLPDLPGLPGLSGLLRFGDAVSSGSPSASPSATAIYGGAP